MEVTLETRLPHMVTTTTFPSSTRGELWDFEETGDDSEDDIPSIFVDKAVQVATRKSKRRSSKRALKNNSHNKENKPAHRMSARKILPRFIRPKFAPMTMQTKRVILGEHQCNPHKDYYGIKLEEDYEDAVSCIYVTSQAGANYRLTFKTYNGSMEPLFIRPRSPPPNKNEKINQIRSRMKVFNEPNKLNHVAIKRPKWSLVGSTISEKPIPPIKVYNLASINMKEAPNSISKPQRSKTTGFIYVKVDNFAFKVRVQPLPITKIRPPISKAVRETMERLKMPCSDEFKNKAHLLIRYGNDLIRLKFNLSNCNVSRLPEYKSLAVQTENHVVICQRISHFRDKRVNLRLPESTYVYHDPMTNIYRANHYFTSMNITPLWKYEMYQKRIAQMRDHDPLEGEIGKVIKRARGSLIVFDGFDAIVTVNGGLMCAMVVMGQEAYEEKLRLLQDDRNKADQLRGYGDWDETYDMQRGKGKAALWENDENEGTLEKLDMPSLIAN